MMNTCELIMLDRDTCGRPAAPCPLCNRAFCPQCFQEHAKIHEPAPAEPRKLEVNMAICTRCETVCGATVKRQCPSCGKDMEPLKAALRADGRAIAFYTEDEVAKK